MTTFIRGLAKFVGALLELLGTLPKIFSQSLPFLRGLWRAILRGFRKPDRGGCCLHLSPAVHLRADPMLYAQYWLMSQGLAVTWDNPDIQIQDLMGTPVSPEGLVPDRDYEVIVRIWNGSYGAPAVGIGVELSYIHIGFGNTQTAIGTDSADLGVKGSSHCPAFARFIWRTPAVKGHYCLLALLIWLDDANPNNNLGQKNTLVGETHSPATFAFTVTNDAAVRRRYEFEVDMYSIPELPPCQEQVEAVTNRRLQPARSEGRYAESKSRWVAAFMKQGYGKFPVTSDWRVVFSAAEFFLEPGASLGINVSLEYTRGNFSGMQPFNIHGFATPPNGPRKLAGGVTLYVEGQ